MLQTLIYRSIPVCTVTFPPLPLEQAKRVSGRETSANGFSHLDVHQAEISTAVQDYLFTKGTITAAPGWSLFDEGRSFGTARVCHSLPVSSY